MSGGAARSTTSLPCLGGADPGKVELFPGNFREAARLAGSYGVFVTADEQDRTAAKEKDPP